MADGNKTKLLRAARELLRTQGYAHITARDLAAASGANLASIGYHFGGKDQLLNAAIAEGMAEWTDAVVREVMAGDADLVEQARRVLGGTLDRFAELRPELLAFVEAFPAAVRDEELRTRLAASYAGCRAAGAESVRRALADAVDEADAAVISTLVLALCDGLLLQWLLDPGAVGSGDDVLGAVLRVSGAVSAGAP